jgi:hypothetical protein
MTPYLTLQLFISFIVGGGFITFLSLIAERANKNISGIIMMFPTTIVLGFFFLGLTTSAEDVAKVIPATVVPLGLVVFSSVIYIYLSLLFSRFIKVKYLQIIFTYFSSTLIWFLLAAPFAMYKFSNLAVGTAGYLLLMVVSHLLLNRKDKEARLVPTVYNRTQVLLRALFMGFVISAVVLLGKLANPFWGGVFSLYPAVSFAALITFHFYYEPAQLFSLMKKAPLGSLSLYAYAISAMILFPKFGLIGGTLLSYCICLACTFTLIQYKLRTVTK